MAGFVTWLRQQTDREDSVGVLSRELVRDDPSREIWTLEGLRERMFEDGVSAGRYDALAAAVVEWGARMGISVHTGREGQHNILAPRQRDADDAAAPDSGAEAPIPVAVEAGHGRAANADTFSVASANHGFDRGRDTSRGTLWRDRESQPAVTLPDLP